MKQTIPLNGYWKFAPDLEIRPTNNADTRPIPFQARPDLIRRHWQNVEVPGVWATYGARYEIYEGVCWYAREFVVPRFPPGTPSRLRFGAVNYHCEVYLNGRPVGMHETGYTEFVLDATEALQEGVNLLAVRVDNRAAITKWPNDRGYFNYGGIHRDVTLEILEGTCLVDVSVVTDYDTDSGCGIVRLEGTARQAGDLDIGISLNGKSYETHADGTGHFRTAIRDGGLSSWSPGSPRCYDLVIRLAHADRCTFLVGFKRLEVTGGKLLLNGQGIRLKGVCYVYDSPVAGLVMTEAQVTADIAEMAEMGVNAVRSHYPLDERFYEACDRNGILVWIEPPIYCYKPADTETNTCFAQPEYLEAARTILTEMVRTAKRHVSVAIYGIGNECNVAHPEAEPFFRDLAALVRSCDATRPISFAALYGNVARMAEIVDILGVNSYYGWYDRISTLYPPKPRTPDAEGRLDVAPIDLAGLRRMLDDVIRDRPKDLAVLLTEFGADSIPGYRSDSRDFWSEDYHAALLAATFDVARQVPNVVGTFPFCFTDYRDPSKPVNGFWNEQNLKGMLTYERVRKLPFYAVQAEYRGGTP
jgi:beta-glucuronidase